MPSGMRTNKDKAMFACANSHSQQQQQIRKSTVMFTLYHLNVSFHHCQLIPHFCQIRVFRKVFLSKSNCNSIKKSFSIHSVFQNSQDVLNLLKSNNYIVFGSKQFQNDQTICRGVATIYARMYAGAYLKNLKICLYYLSISLFALVIYLFIYLQVFCRKATFTHARVFSCIATILRKENFVNIALFFSI